MNLKDMMAKQQAAKKAAESPPTEPIAAPAQETPVATKPTGVKLGISIGVAKPKVNPLVAVDKVLTPKIISQLNEEPEVVLVGPDMISERLARLDRLANEIGISQINIDAARGYLKEVMVELKVHPEYESILIDKDVHNIMKFVRASQTKVGAEREKLTQKRTASAAKAMTAPKFNLDVLKDKMATFKSPSQKKFEGLQGLDAFAAINADEIKAKMGK